MKQETKQYMLSSHITSQFTFHNKTKLKIKWFFENNLSHLFSKMNYFLDINNTEVLT